MIQSQMEPSERMPAYAADVTYGTNAEFGFDYLRDNMVVRPERPRAARPPLRDRRRGRLDPDRRGQNPAHHLRRRHQVRRDLQAVRQGRAAPASRRGLRARRGQAHHRGDRGRACASVEGLLNIDDIYADPSGQLVNHLQQSLKARVPLQARRRLRGQRRRGHDRRRVHRPHDDRPSLLGGPAPGDRGQGARARSRGEPDARDHHAAELLPPLREALGHDRYGASPRTRSSATSTSSRSR